MAVPATGMSDPQEPLLNGVASRNSEMVAGAAGGNKLETTFDAKSDDCQLEDLVEGLASLDDEIAHAAFEKIYPLIRSRMWRVAHTTARRWSGSPEDAKDAFQDVHASLISKVRAGAYVRRVRGGFVAWCCALVRNRVRELLKRRRRTLCNADDPVIQESLADEGLWANPERRAEVALLEARVARLPKRQREILRMRHQGFSYEEIAHTNGISEDYARQLYRRALKALAKSPKK